MIDKVLQQALDEEKKMTIWFYHNLFKKRE